MHLNYKLLLLVLSLLPAGSYADTDLQKIEFIQQHFDREARHSKLWQHSWTAVIGGNALASAIMANNTDESRDRTDLTASTITGTLGTVNLLRKPLQTHKYATQLANMPTQTPDQIQAKREQAERWLTLTATQEQQEKSLNNHLVSGLVNAITGVAIAKHGGRDKAGLQAFLTGMLFSEIKIWTAPNNSSRALQQYQNGDLQQNSANKPRLQFNLHGSMLSANVLF